MPALEVSQALGIATMPSRDRDLEGNLQQDDNHADDRSTTSEPAATLAAAAASVQEQPLLQNAHNPNETPSGNTIVLPRASGCVLLPAILAFTAHLIWGVLLLAKWEALEDVAFEATGSPHVSFGNFTSMHTGAKNAGPSWYVVFIPAWLCEVISVAFAVIALFHRAGRAGPSARNVACVHVNSVLQSVCTATFQLLLAVRLDTEHGSWAVVFMPWYLAIGVQSVTHYAKVPDARGRRPGFPVSMQHLLALVISFKLGGAFDYRRSSWANVLWPLWGVAGFTGVLLSLLLCCGVPMLVRRHASGSGTHVQLMVLLVLVLLCATYLPAVVSAVRLAAWLDGEPDISAASILAPYLVACSIVLLTLVACLLTLAFTPASLRTIAVSAPEAEEAEEGSGVAHLFSTLPAPYALVRESSTLFRPIDAGCTHTTGGPSTNGPAAAVANDAAADSDGGGDLGEGEVCWICVSGPRDAVLLECGHGGICYSCAERCARKRPPLCPMCRQRISCVVRLDDGPEERIDGQVVVKVQA